MLSIALRMLILWTFITGFLYPLCVTGLAQVLFPHQANGSLLADGKGSELIGQNFTAPKYFWGRPSAISKTEPGKDAVSTPYDASNSSGSNQGVNDPKQADSVKASTALFGAKAPTDLLTASGSGLDPHIIPAGAEFQVERVAKARHIEPALVREMVRRHTQLETFGVLGGARVNVLLLNRDLDGL